MERLLRAHREAADGAEMTVEQRTSTSAQCAVPNRLTRRRQTQCPMTTKEAALEALRLRYSEGHAAYKRCAQAVSELNSRASRIPRNR
jgi:hypothetical protein